VHGAGRGAGVCQSAERKARHGQHKDHQLRLPKFGPFHPRISHASLCSQTATRYRLRPAASDGAGQASNPKAEPLSSMRRFPQNRNGIVQFFRSLLGAAPLKSMAVAALAVALPSLVLPNTAHAEAWLVVEADTGRVLQADNATMPWYPASVTKIM